jgi:hypothetical protein
VVGLDAVLQTIPLVDTVAPPFDTIVPPLVADVVVMLVAGVVVVTVGTTMLAHALVVKETLAPYDVP